MGFRPPPLVNRVSAVSVEIDWNGLIMEGFKSLDYKTEKKRGDVWGSGQKKIGRTRGRQVDTCSFVMYKEEFEFFRRTLGVGGVGFGETPFMITAIYYEVGILAPIIDMVYGAVLESAGNNVNTDDQGNQVVACDLNVMDIALGAPGQTISFPYPIA